MRLGLDECHFSKTVTGAKLAKVLEKPDFFPVRVFGDMISGALLFCFFQRLVITKKASTASEPSL